MISGYFLHILILVEIYVILSLSLNLSLGYAGMINLGHAALFGIGAYTSALLARSGTPFALAFLASGTLTSILGWGLAISTNRLKGDYFALAALGFSFVAHSLMLNLSWLTRGPLGVSGIPKPSFFGWSISSDWAYAVFALAVAALSVYCIYRITCSPFGNLLQAVRDDEIGVRVLGKNTAKVKCKAMAVSAFFAGIAGSLFAHYITYIDPASFSLSEIVLLLTIVIVGGLASIRGSVLGVIVILAVPEFLRFLPISGGLLGPARQILYACILLGIILFRPRGICGRVDLE